ncbi:N-acyl amino acid synthase FeeM domain-containing protein [Limobrevibacterium gyesilva]|uniref:N-acyl amino acid synthase FeeM domain-containing protein n=1 Tax=Limobrevibacterium gyesilva TaxID=2991712 RepID=UPI002225DC06|nr:GNAT family N-acyltransferase [Limobrevibacterium gyesilva]
MEIEIADRAEIVREAYHLRHQVYCVERGYLTGSAGLEVDEFDLRARQAVLRSRQTEEVLGTVRLVLPAVETPDDSFPMQRVCAWSILRPHVPLTSTAEISRFAISKQRRAGTSTLLMRLKLMQGIVRLSSELNLTHWCAVMEPSLLRLLQMTYIDFQPAGPVVDYHGPRQPCFNSIRTVLERIGSECPDLWQFLTEGGRHYPWSRKRELAAA